MKRITKLQRQYHGIFTYGLLHALERLERGHYKILKIKRLNRNGDAIVKTKIGKKIKTFKFDFSGDRL